MKAIVYVSNTGSAMKYAEMLSEKTGIPAYDFSKSEAVEEGSDVIFIGWIMAGAVQGLEQARERFGKLLAVCPVGMMKSDDLVKKNSITEPMFFLQGDFHMDRLKGMHKMMMGMMVKMMKSKMKELEEEKSKKILEVFENGIDCVSEDKLTDIINWLEENK